jgi:hypothetical protein
MELNKCTHKKNDDLKKKNVSCDFKSSLGPKKSWCEVPYGTTQGWVWPQPKENNYSQLFS